MLTHVVFVTTDTKTVGKVIIKGLEETVQGKHLIKNHMPFKRDTYSKEESELLVPFERYIEENAEGFWFEIPVSLIEDDWESIEMVAEAVSIMEKLEKRKYSKELIEKFKHTLEQTIDSRRTVKDKVIQWLLKILK